MLEYFYDDDFEDDAVVVLEFLPSDIEAVISSVKRRGSAITPGEAKSWMLQVLICFLSCSCNYCNLFGVTCWISDQGRNLTKISH